MKKINYLIFALTIITLSIGSVFAASVTFPSVIELKVGEKKVINVPVSDMLINVDIANSDPTVVKSDDFAMIDSATDKHSFNVEGLKEGEATLTVSDADQAGVYSTEQPYNFTPKTITVRVLSNSTSPGTDPVPGNDTPTTKPTKDDTVDEPTKNPKTGIEDYILPVIGVNILLFGSYFFIKKFSVFKSF